MSNMPLFKQLTGQTDEHILQSPFPEGISRPIHCEMQNAFHALQQDARKAGYDLQLASGFRSFERQCVIWNEKVSGLRPLLDGVGKEIDGRRLNDLDKVHAIMRWSALPGTSRHHWGSDIDIYDAAAVAENYQVQLTPEEVDSGGVFFPLHQWLDNQIDNHQACGFFRPYAIDRGGVAAEKWHLSYAPLAVKYQLAFDPEQLMSLLIEKELMLIAVIQDHFDELYQRYVKVPVDCYPPNYRKGLISGC